MNAKKKVTSFTNRSNNPMTIRRIYNSDFDPSATHFDQLSVSVHDTTKSEANMRRLVINCVAAASAGVVEATLPDAGEAL